MFFSKKETIDLSNIESSLKYFDFAGMSAQEIVDKFETTLCHRENQLKELANTLGSLNEKVITVKLFQ